MIDRSSPRLDRRRFALGGLALAGGAGLFPGAAWAADASADNPGPIPPRIKALYRNSVAIDCLASPNTFNVNYPVGGKDLSPEQLRNVRASGLTAVNMSVGGPTLERTRERIAKIYGAQGQLSLRSAPGRGVTVQIVLPCRT